LLSTPRSPAVPPASAGDYEAPADERDSRGEDQPRKQYKQVSTRHKRLPCGSGPSVTSGMPPSQRAGTHDRWSGNG